MMTVFELPLYFMFLFWSQTSCFNFMAFAMLNDVGVLCIYTVWYLIGLIWFNKGYAEYAELCFEMYTFDNFHYDIINANQSH